MAFKAVQIIEPLVDLNQPLRINHIETPKLNGNQVIRFEKKGQKTYKNHCFFDIC